MYEELQLALMDLCVPERLDVLLDAHQTLTQLGMTQMDEELRTIIGLQHGIADTDLLLARIEDCFFYAMTEALAEYGITLVDEATLSDRTAVLSTIGCFEYYLIPETLHDIAHSDGESEEILAALCPLFSGLSTEHALSVIESVSDATISRIRQVAEERLPDQTPERTLPDDYHTRIERINSLIRDLPEQHLSLVRDLSDHNVPCGAPLELMIGMVLESLHAVDTERFSYELLCLLYYSNTPLDHIGARAVELLVDFTDERGEQIRIRRTIEALYHHHSGLHENCHWPSLETYG